MIFKLAKQLKDRHKAPKLEGFVVVKLASSLPRLLASLTTDMEPGRGEKKRPRSKSAKARLTPVPPPGGPPHKSGEILEERVRSAKAIKSKHTSSSGVLARPPSRSAGSTKRFTTMYSKDFDGTFVPAAEIRPTSPTRRNNPHPGKVDLPMEGCEGGGAHYSLGCLFSSSNSWYGGCQLGKLELSLTKRDWSYHQSISLVMQVSTYYAAERQG